MSETDFEEERVLGYKEGRKKDHLRGRSQSYRDSAIHARAKKLGYTGSRGDAFQQAMEQGVYALGSDSCGPDEEYVPRYRKGNGILVDGYCRKKHPAPYYKPSIQERVR